MSINFKVQASMVEQLTISFLCAESYPCQHSCKIVLSDGKTRETTLNGSELDCLIREIAKEKILYDHGYNACLTHFDYTQYRIRYNIQKEPADAILTKLFSQDESKIERKNNLVDFFYNTLNTLIFRLHGAH